MSWMFVVWLPSAGIAQCQQTLARVAYLGLVERLVSLIDVDFARRISAARPQLIEHAQGLV